MEFDLFDDGVKSFWDQKMDGSYGEEHPAGGYDFPVSCILSKAPAYGSDLHADIFDYPKPEPEEEDFEWATDFDLAPPIMAKEKGPSDTRSPFKYPPGMEQPVGLVGKAYKPFSEICCVLEAYDKDTTGLKNWFRDEWNIPDDFDLERGFPVLTSKSDAMWGGIGRTLHPFCTMLKSAQPLIKITHHGKHRKDFGKHKLVDWSRIEEVARLLMVQMLADDYTADKNVKRADWRIVPFELPDAPQASDVQWDFEYERIYHSDGDLWKSLEQAFGFADQISSVEEQRFVEGKVEVILQEEVSQQTVLKAILGKRLVGPPIADWFTTDENDILPVERVDKKIKDLDHLRKGNLYTLLTALLTTRYRRDPGVFPRAAHIGFLLKGLDEFGRRKVVAPECTAVIKSVCGDNFLSVVRKFADFTEYGRGDTYYIELTHLMGAFQGDYQLRHPKKLFNVLINRDKGRRFMLSQIKTVIGYHDHHLTSISVNDLFAGAIISGNAAIDKGVFIARHKKKWCARFYREAKGRIAEKDKSKHVPIEQLKGASLANAKIRVSDTEKAQWNVQDVVNVFVRAANRFLDKRRTLFGQTVKISVPEDIGLREAAVMIDRQIVNNSRKRPLVTFAEAADEVHKALDLFVNDVSLIFNDLIYGIADGKPVQDVEDMPDEEMELEVGSDKDQDEEEEEDDVDIYVGDTVTVDFSRKSTVPKPVPDLVIEEVEEIEPEMPEEGEDEAEAQEEEEEDDDDFGFDDDDEVDENAGKMDLHAELSEDNPDMTETEKLEYIQVFGQYVTVEQWETIKGLTKKAYEAKLLLAATKTGDAGGADLL